MNKTMSAGLESLSKNLTKFWELSGQKILSIEKDFDTAKGAPVITKEGKYTAQGWTEWTQGFQYGSALLQFEVTGDKDFLTIGREATIHKMAPHITHSGVHDHGFNNISTYGNLLRLMSFEKIPFQQSEKEFYALALKTSGVVQAMRWTKIKDGGFIYSFNGPHSLFVDTIRSCRILMISYLLGHKMLGENDQPINLLHRAVQHLLATAKYSIFYGQGRDAYDVRGRTAHECVFNTNDGNYRCPNAQQGYSGLTTWTRGLSWAICGFAEELELIKEMPDDVFNPLIQKNDLEKILINAALATADFYMESTPTDGIPYWDTGAPDLHQLGDYTHKKSDPFNQYEPVDSSAAAIAGQGFLRLGKYLNETKPGKGDAYWNYGLLIANSVFQPPYISEEPHHQGILLHSIYHHPNGWDHIPNGRRIPYGESSMWGDYHVRELALYLMKIIQNQEYYTFFNYMNPQEIPNN